VSAVKTGALDAEVACVISDIADSGIIALAKREGLPHFIVDPGPHPKRFADSAQKEVCEHLQRASVDVVVLAGFMRILKEPTMLRLRGSHRQRAPLAAAEVQRQRCRPACH